MHSYAILSAEEPFKPTRRLHKPQPPTPANPISTLATPWLSETTPRVHNHSFFFPSLWQPGVHGVIIDAEFPQTLECECSGGGCSYRKSPWSVLVIWIPGANTFWSRNRDLNGSVGSFMGFLRGWHANGKTREDESQGWIGIYHARAAAKEFMRDWKMSADVE